MQSGTMMDTPKGMRTHIGLYGRRNAGKSSLVNALAGQQISIVSDTPGTTTDPVEKVMEFLPVGPVVFLDTAGIDDVGDLGELRRERTLNLLARTDLALIVTDGVWGPFERELRTLCRKQQIPCCCVCTKTDLAEPAPAFLKELEKEGLVCVPVSAQTGSVQPVREAIVRLAQQASAEQPKFLADLVPAGSLVLLVTPIDTGAPKGRLILPQVQAIRDLLDARCLCMVVTEGELTAALALATPALVVCDSQVVKKAVALTPPTIPLTTFSILMARLKGDLVELARGAAAITHLKPGDHILIGEACSHHPQADDIGRVKIPRWMEAYAGGPLHFDFAAGRDLRGEANESLTKSALMIHCGGCMLTRRGMLGRMRLAAQAGVPITNYGVAISLVQGVLERALELFPEALAAFREDKQYKKASPAFNAASFTR